MDISTLTPADITAIAKLAKIEPKQVEGLITMATTRKMPKAETVFKASVTKLDKKTKRQFTFVEEDKGSFFFVDLLFPLLKKDLQPKVKEVEKQLANAKDKDKAGLEAYLAFLNGLLDRVLKKKMSGTYGHMKFATSEEGKCYMNVVGKVQGARKASLHEVVNLLDLKAKSGDALCFVDPKETPPEDDTEETAEDTDAAQDTAGDDTTAQDTAGDDTTAQDTAGDDTAQGADSASDASGETSRGYQKLEKAFGKITTALGAFQSETDSKKKIRQVKPLLNHVEKLSTAVGEFLGKTPNEADTQAATTLQTKLDGYKDTLSKMNDNIGQKQSEATVKGMTDIFDQIKAEANKIKGDYGDEIANGESNLSSILDELLA